MAVALLGAMDHAAALVPENQAEINRFTGHCKEAMYSAFREGRGTRDLSGPSGLTTEGFVESVAADLAVRMASGEVATHYEPPAESSSRPSNEAAGYLDIDEEAMKKFFKKFNADSDGIISFDEFVEMTLELGIAPKVKVEEKVPE